MCVARTGSYFEFRAKNRKEEESLWLVSLRGLVTTTQNGQGMLNSQGFSIELTLG